MPYNATAYKLDIEGNVVSVQAVEVDSDGLVVRAGGYWSHKIGTAAYDADWRRSQFSNVADIRIDLDGAEGYKNKLRGLALPPAYVAA